MKNTGLISKTIILLSVLIIAASATSFAKNDLNPAANPVTSPTNPPVSKTSSDEKNESDCFDENGALALLRQYAASDPLPNYFIDENQYVRENEIDVSEFGDFAVRHDADGSTVAVSMENGNVIDKYDVDGVTLFTKARLQFLRCPDTMMILDKEIESVQKTSFPDFLNRFISDEAYDSAPVLSALSGSRYAITNSNIDPYYAVCYIEMTFPSGASGYGTGFLINSNTVVTAGHVIYQPSLGGWASSVTVTPGKNGNVNPYGTKSYASMYVGGTWHSSSNPDGDFGVIRLSSNSDTPSHFWLKAKTDAALSNLAITMSGYPSDKHTNVYTMWRSTGNIYGTSTYQFYCDAYGTSGVSGAPVYDSMGWVVGIATGNAPGAPATGGSTRAVRITQTFINWVSGL